MIRPTRRPVLAAAACTLVAAAALPLAVPSSAAARPARTAAEAPGTASASAPGTVDLRHLEDGRHVPHDYAFDGALRVYADGDLGLGETEDGPVLASVVVTPQRTGSTGTVHLTITSDRPVTFSPSSFTWLAPGVATGPDTWRDVRVPAGTHTRVLTFEGVAAGTVEFTPEPDETWDWVTP